MLIIKDMLYHRRQYIIDVKAVLLENIEKFGSGAGHWWDRLLMLVQMVRLIRKYPVPTKENTIFQNTHIYLDVQADFRKWHKNRGRQLLIDVGIRLLADECEHDGYYAFLYETFVVECLMRGWRPEHRGFPMYRYWTGPLSTDNFNESNKEFFDKRIEEVLKEVVQDRDQLEKLRREEKLWYDNPEKMLGIKLNAIREAELTKKGG